MRPWLYIILFASLSSYAQDPSLYFEKLTIQHGLSHNKVNCIIQDRRGFTWLGTDDGLNRYDGKRFVQFRYRQGDSTTISGNIITDLLEDKEGRLWIATADGGMSRYDYRLPPAEQFKQYRHSRNDPASIPANTINTLHEDHAGFLWLGTSGRSVIRFNKATGRFDDITKNNKTILDLSRDNDGVIWVGRQGGGIMKIDPASLAVHEDERYRNLYAKLPHVTVTALHKDHDGNMWFGSWDKLLYKFNVESGAEEVYNSSTTPAFIDDEIRCFAEDAKGRLWMGGKEKGLQVFDKVNNRFSNYRHDPSGEGSISDDRINCIYLDKQERLWIGTNRGISISNPQKQQFVQRFLGSKNNGDIILYDFYEDDEKNIWLGSSEGIYILRKDGSTSKKEIVYKGQRLHVSSFYKDDEGHMYLGTNYSLFLYDEEKNSVSLLPNTEKDGVMNRIIESRVVSVVDHKIDGRPVLMVLPYGHFMAYYDWVNKQWISRLHSSEILKRFNLKDNLLRKFYKTKDGSLWMATAKEGLAEWKPGASAWSYYSHDSQDPHSISNNAIYDMVEDEKNNLWISSFGGGLNYFDRKSGKFSRIASTHNLIEGIALDDDQNVWMISNGNVHKYDPHKKTHTTYPLPDLEKSGGVSGKIARAGNGRLYISGKNYFISFHPDSIIQSASEPRVWLTDFQVFNKSFSHWLQQDEIRINYKDNYFGFEFAAPGSNIHYSYMLEGFDKDWVDAGERNYVSFSNLDGGEYTFKVRASNSPGVWTSDYASMKLVVVPPFWKRPVFYIALFSLLLLGGYGIYRYRITEIIKRQAIRNKIAQDLHDNVGSTLSSISVYSQVARIYQQQDKSKELGQAIEKIGSASSEMISELNDTVWVIMPGNDNMEVLLQRMDSFAKPLLRAKDIDFHLIYDASIVKLSLEMEKRRNFYLVFKEAVNNALKYSNGKNLTVEISHEGQYLDMIITDDGQGFDLDSIAGAGRMHNAFGGGNGLMNMQRRAHEMKGTFKIDTAPGKGTKVELVFRIP